MTGTEVLNNVLSGLVLISCTSVYHEKKMPWVVTG